MARRNIIVGDVLRNVTLYIGRYESGVWVDGFPEDFVPGTNRAMFINCGSAYIENYALGSSIKRIRLSDGTQLFNRSSSGITVNLSSYTLPDSSLWGAVTSIISDDVSYPYFWIEDGTSSKHTIRFLNYDGSVLQSSTVADGEIPTYEGETPTKPSDGDTEYVFSGWLPEIAAATQNQDYTAQFESRGPCTITWNINGLITTEKAVTGQMPSYKGITRLPGKLFKGFSPALSTLTGDITYTAVYEDDTDLKDLVTEYGKMIDATLKIGESADSCTEYTVSDIVSVQKYYEGNLFHTIMKQLDIELDNVTNDFKGKKVIGQSLTIIGGSDSKNVPGWQNDGDYIIQDIKQNEDKASVTLECYDLMIKSMVDYVSVIDFKDSDGNSNNITVKQFLEAICEYIGVPYSGQQFANSDLVIPEELYDNSYTFRDVLDEICAVAAGTMAIIGNTLYILYPQPTDYTLSTDMSKTVTIGEKYGPVNSIVFARTPQEDNLYKQDTKNIETNGLTELRIEDNQIIEQWRTIAENTGDETAEQAALTAIFNRLSGLQYYVFEADTFGCLEFDILNVFNVEGLDGSLYSSIVLNDKITLDQGLNEQLKIEKPEETLTEYKAATKTDSMLRKTILRVDKQEGRIEEVIQSTKKMADSVSGLEKSVTTSLERIDTAESSILKITKEIDDGVTKVKTTNGYTFDDEGMTVGKFNGETPDPTSSTLSNTGVRVKRKNGTSTEEVLTATDTGVNAINLTSRKYLIVGNNARFENYKDSQNREVRTACFYIGG